MATAVAEDLKRVSKKKKNTDIGQIPQWRLMVRRFMQSKLSVAGGIVLIIMYLMAIFADFLVPNHYDDIDTNNAWSAPTSVSFAGGGPGVCALKQTLDEKTFTWIYTQDCSTVSPIKFFVHGYPYSLLGIIPTDTHLFGVDAPAKLFLWGADREGRSGSRCGRSPRSDRRRHRAPLRSPAPPPRARRAVRSPSSARAAAPPTLSPSHGAS